MNIGNIKVSIKLGDITEENTDAIVNPINNSLIDVKGAVFKKGGNVVLEQCKKHGGCPTGEAKITVAGNLNAKYIIHTAAPMYRDHEGLAEKLLYLTYINSLKLASDYNLVSISFPSVSTDAEGYTFVKALPVVFQSVKDFASIGSSLVEIRFVLHNQEDYEVYKDYISRLYID
jgi:O-acetyl-ADP-ribose deacetylase (regulator of RNase III)